MRIAVGIRSLKSCMHAWHVYARCLKNGGGGKGRRGKSEGVVEGFMVVVMVEEEVVVGRSGE